MKIKEEKKNNDESLEEEFKKKIYDTSIYFRKKLSKSLVEETKKSYENIKKEYEDIIIILEKISKKSIEELKKILKKTEENFEEIQIIKEIKEQKNLEEYDDKKTESYVLYAVPENMWRTYKVGLIEAYVFETNTGAKEIIEEIGINKILWISHKLGTPTNSSSITGRIKNYYKRHKEEAEKWVLKVKEKNTGKEYEIDEECLLPFLREYYEKYEKNLTTPFKHEIISLILAEQKKKRIKENRNIIYGYKEEYKDENIIKELEDLEEYFKSEEYKKIKEEEKKKIKEIDDELFGL